MLHAFRTSPLAVVNMQWYLWIVLCKDDRNFAAFSSYVAIMCPSNLLSSICWCAGNSVCFPIRSSACRCLKNCIVDVVVFVSVCSSDVIVFRNS